MSLCRVASRRVAIGYRDRAEDFAALDATVVGISAQDVESHRGFAEKNGLTAKRCLPRARTEALANTHLWVHPVGVH